ncbi:hypothetical protein O181_093038, partial [Austropuccinia psidii MF-1]|nr:hypothetical protein [Austropuccinia psidii MF-1]
SKFSLQDSNISGIPLSNLSQQPQQASTLSWCSGAHHSRSQNPTPISKEDYSAHQSGKLWQQSEDSSRIPATCICRSWVGTLFRIIQKGQFSRGITSMQSVVKASSTSILLGQLNSSVQASFNQPVWPWPNWAISYSTV